jgi:ABC-type lipopolysaccharide export system ATPase subunit
MANVSEEALRVIGTTRAWSKNYSVVRALAFNPKAPISISMTLVNRLVEKDVRMLAADRNVPEPVKILARKIVQAGQLRKH